MMFRWILKGVIFIDKYVAPKFHLQDIERYIERQLVIVLRTMFSMNDRFCYDDDDRISRLTISPQFPSSEAPNAENNIVVSDISYSLNTRMGLGHNFGN